MTNKKAILISLFTLILTSGCASTLNRNFPSAPLSLEMSAKLTPEVEVDMSKKITGYATLKKILIFTTQEPELFADGVTYSPGGGNSGGGGFFSFFAGGGNEERVKSAAAYNALNTAKADFIVAPVYTIKNVKNIFTQEITVQVTGYAGKLKNIKPATP